mgnify:CR=1 FL=1
MGSEMCIRDSFLIAGLVVAYLIQDINNKVEKSKSRISDYGKEVVRVEQDA